MKRKIMAVTLTAAMLAGLAAVPVWADDAGSDEGKVLTFTAGMKNSNPV